MKLNICVQIIGKSSYI